MSVSIIFYVLGCYSLLCELTEHHSIENFRDTGNRQLLLRANI